MRSGQPHPYPARSPPTLSLLRCPLRGAPLSHRRILTHPFADSHCFDLRTPSGPLRCPILAQSRLALLRQKGFSEIPNPRHERQPVLPQKCPNPSPSAFLTVVVRKEPGGPQDPASPCLQNALPHPGAHFGTLLIAPPPLFEPR